MRQLRVLSLVYALVAIGSLVIALLEIMNDHLFMGVLFMLVGLWAHALGEIYRLSNDIREHRLGVDE